MQQSLLRIASVTQRTGLPTSTIYAYMKAGSFPQPIRISERSVAWKSQDIDAWIAAKMAAHDEPSK